MMALARPRTTVRCARCGQTDQWTAYMRCSRCKASIYCSNDCQSSDWTFHQTRCTPVSPQQSPPPPYEVLGVTIPCSADRSRGARSFEATMIDSSHAIHTQGIPCPLLQQVGFPLVLFRHILDDPTTMTRDPGLDNQVATHLLTSPSTGHPDDKWLRAGYIGTVTVMRHDWKPLSLEAMETAFMYVDHILNMFRDGVSPARLLNPAGFQRFCQRYKERMASNGYTTFQAMTIPL